MLATRRLGIEPQPDFNRLLTVLQRKGEPDRVPFFELFSNIEGPVLQALGLAEPQGDRDALEHHLRSHITYQLACGYDYVNVGAYGFGFPRSDLPRAMTPHGERAYYLASSHTIATREDFEQYPWPDTGQLSLAGFERVEPLLPEGMKVIVVGPGGVLENVMWLLGYEGVSYLMADDEPLVRDMFDAVGSRLEAMFDQVAALDVVGAINLGDDLGFRTQTLISPAALRDYVFPWHQRIVAAAHRHGKAAILHACGNLDEVMDDIIACGWDAKHSFEDAICPVWEAKARWGDRIAFLGGFDVDKIARMTPDEVRAHTRLMIERCAPGGGWALGTGNSVCNYVPVENYLAMVDEGWRAGRYAS